VSALALQLARMVSAQVLEAPAHWRQRSSNLAVAQAAFGYLRDDRRLASYWPVIVHLRGSYLSGGRLDVNIAASLALFEVVGDSLARAAAVSGPEHD